MTTPVELDGWRKSDLRANVALRDRLFQLLFSDVQIVHVGRVMLGMMQLHYLRAYNRLERPVVVRQVWQRVLRPRGDILAAEKTPGG